MKKKVFIDCDTGIDDALAFVLACASEDIEIIGVTTVGGNVSLENTTRNTHTNKWSSLGMTIIDLDLSMLEIMMDLKVKMNILQRYAGKFRKIL